MYYYICHCIIIACYEINNICYYILLFLLLCHCPCYVFLFYYCLIIIFYYL